MDPTAKQTLMGPRPIRERLMRYRTVARAYDYVRGDLAFRIAAWAGETGPGVPRWRCGVHDFAWTFYCGYGLWFALRILCMWLRPRWAYGSR